MVLLQSQAFPLGERMNYLSIHADRWDIKTDRAFIAVQIIVQAGVFRYKQGGGNPLQIQRGGEFLLEGGLDIRNGPLGVISVQSRPVALGYVNLIHIFRPFLPAISVNRIRVLL